MKYIGYFFAVIGVVIGVSALGLLVKAIFFPMNVLQKEFQLGSDTVDKTLTADNAIYNYEWFKTQKEEIDATNKKLEIAVLAADSFDTSAGSRKDWTFEDKGESARLHAVAQGIEGALKDMIAQYNARLSMANRNIFTDGIVPNPIDALTFIFKK